MRVGWIGLALLFGCLACGPVAEDIPSPPQGAVPFRPATGIPDDVSRMEIALAARIEARFKPIDWSLYSLPSAISGEAVWNHYEASLSDWRAAADWTDRDARYRIWTRDDDVVAVAVLSPEAEPSLQILMVLTDR